MEGLTSSHTHRSKERSFCSQMLPFSLDGFCFVRWKPYWRLGEENGIMQRDFPALCTHLFRGIHDLLKWATVIETRFFRGDFKPATLAQLLIPSQIQNWVAKHGCEAEMC